MYSRSEDFGETFSEPIQVNYLNNNIIAYGQSGSKIEAFNDNIFITYIDDRIGSWSVYLSISYDNGLTWQETLQLMKFLLYSVNLQLCKNLGGLADSVTV